MSGVRGYDNPDSTSSSSDDSANAFTQRRGQDGYDTDEMEIVPFNRRSKGPSHPGLASLKPSNKLYDRLMSYRYYRLIKTKHTRTHESTFRLHKLIRNLELSFKDSKFSGEDPILIFDFLSRFVEEADTLTMSEAQAFMALPQFLTGTARMQYRAARSGSRSGGLACWPEAVQYLLRTYATQGAIRDAIHHLRSLRQDDKESERTFATRVNEAVYRCGNVHEEDEKMTFYVDGLQQEIRTVVARHREHSFRDEMTFELLVQFAQDEGDAVRSRNASSLGTRGAATTNASVPGILRTPRRATAPTARQIAFLEPSGSTPDASSRAASAALEAGELNALYEGDTGASDITSQLPSTLQDEAIPESITDAELQELVNQQLLFMDKARNPYPRARTPPRIRPPAIAHENPKQTNRIGWPDRLQQLICHACYARGHIMPNCTLPVTDMATVVSNYEKLSAVEHTRVPPQFYHRALRFVDPTGGEPPQPKDSGDDQKMSQKTSKGVP